MSDRKLCVFGVAIALSVGMFPAAASEQVFPAKRPSTRAEAIELLCPDLAEPGLCLRSRIRGSLKSQTNEPPSVRRALELLGRGVSFADERAIPGPAGIEIRFTEQSAAFDRVTLPDTDANGLPDVVDSSMRGLAAAHELLVGQLELAPPQVETVWLVELGASLDGYVIPGHGRRPAAKIVLDASPEDLDSARRSAARLYAYAVALSLSAEFPAGWAEAFSGWASDHLEAAPDPKTLSRIGVRLRELRSGLQASDPVVAAGNAVWFSFLEEVYGLSAVRLAVEELARSVPVATALDRAVRRSSADDLASALREFHIWALLVGDRSDGKHFSFADRLPDPSFSSSREGLPALAVRSEPEVSPLGATQVRLVPRAHRGGMRVHFEGDFSATWEVDLLLIDDVGAIRRLPITLSPEGRGAATVPIQELSEAILLIRNLGSVDGSAHRYSYTAHQEQAFPFELTSLAADWVAGATPGVLVVWETASEQRLVGFNVLRVRDDGSDARVINPVWIPALGTAQEPTIYRFLDTTADPRVGYLYRIHGITRDGLTSRSEASVSPGLGPRPR